MMNNFHRRKYMKLSFYSHLLNVIALILGLTRLDYKGRRLGDTRPVTVKFSNVLGEILISNPTLSEFKPNFKFYI
jgi:hypothetical protein